MNTDSLEDSQFERGETVTDETIVVDGKLFVWRTNFSTRGDIYTSSLPNSAQRYKNGAEVYFELMRRGIGLVPDKPAIDNRGRELPDNHFAFFERHEVKGIAGDIFFYLNDAFPQTFDTTYLDSIEAPVVEKDEVSTLVAEAIEQTGWRLMLGEIGIA